MDKINITESFFKGLIVRELTEKLLQEFDHVVDVNDLDNRIKKFLEKELIAKAKTRKKSSAKPLKRRKVQKSKKKKKGVMKNRKRN